MEDNIGESLGDLGYGDDFLELTPKAQSMKEVTDKLEMSCQTMKQHGGI